MFSYVEKKLQIALTDSPHPPKRMTVKDVVQSLSCVHLFLTPWALALQTSLSFTISRSLLKFISIALVMLSCPLPLSFTFNLSHNSKFFFFHWVSSSHEVTRILKLQHQPFQWLLSVDFLSSTTEHHFCFGLAVSFFLELLVIALYSSSGAYGTSDLGGSSSNVI